MFKMNFNGECSGKKESARLADNRFAIIYLTMARIPGERAHSIQIVRTCDALIREGVMVFLLAPRRHTIASCDMTSFYGLKTHPYLLYIPFPSLIPVTRYGFYLLTLIFYLFALPLLLILSCYLRLLARTVYVYVREPFLLMLLWISFPIHRLPVVYEEHRVPPLSKPYLCSLRCCKHIITISDTQRRILAKNVPWLRDKLVTIPDAFDHNLFCFEEGRYTKQYLRTMLGLPLRNKIVMYVGQLSAWKRIDFIIRAASMLGDDSILCIVGGNKEDIARLKRLAVKLKIRNVLFLGFKPPKQVPLFMKAADVLVHYSPASMRPSTGLSSLSPLKLFEYMAVKKPIVAPRDPFTMEILTDGENALLFNPSDPSDLASKVTKLLHDEDLAKRLSENAFKLSLKYTYKKRAEKIIDLLKK